MALEFIFDFMRNLLVAIAVVVINSSVSGQLGIRINYGFSEAPRWTKTRNMLLPPGQHPKLLGEGYRIGIDHAFRLSQKRIEFYPELFFSRYQQNYANRRYTYHALGVNIHTQIYPLDFEGDCDCPTFSKQGNWLKKGIFLSLSPGIQYASKFLDDLNGDSDFVPLVGIGMGLDIGVSDLLTITPVVQYVYTFSDSWEGLDFGVDPSIEYSSNNSSLHQFIAGIRVGLRLTDD